MILLASASVATRRRWRRGLAHHATREAHDRGQLERAMTQFTPGSVLLDVSLPGLRGPGDIAGLQRLSAASRIIVLAEAPSDSEGLAAFRAGAHGYCHRDLDPALVEKAVASVQKGELWASRGLIARLVAELSAPAPHNGANGSRLSALTGRERETAVLVGGGAANKEIAVHLGVTERTVKAHLTAIFRKTGVNDRLRLALLLNGVSHNGATGPQSNLRTGIRG
ncbi:MAG: DNA-binding response regulator [Candidatus Rokuibacteriota bacterium]|nr:MAG: DNA-binding response regulator [Candidatus Rokubacteria bacterium]